MGSSGPTSHFVSAKMMKTKAHDGAVIWTTEGDKTVNLPAEIPVHSAGTIEHSRWSPYDFNGGTVLAIAGKDFVVMAADILDMTIPAYDDTVPNGCTTEGGAACRCCGAIASC